MAETKFKRGHPKKGGRKKSVPNKVTKNIKDNFEAVFEKLGGTKGFYDWAKKNTHTGGILSNVFKDVAFKHVYGAQRNNIF